MATEKQLRDGMGRIALEYPDLQTELDAPHGEGWLHEVNTGHNPQPALDIAEEYGLKAEVLPYHESDGYCVHVEA